MAVCILSGLEIPKGKMNREHLVPKSRGRKRIVDNPYNIYPCHKVLNSIKGNLLPCEWEERKWNLVYHAIFLWKLPDEDKDFLEKTLVNWEHNYKPNFCEICLLGCQNQR